MTGDPDSTVLIERCHGIGGRIIGGTVIWTQIIVHGHLTDRGICFRGHGDVGMLGLAERLVLRICLTRLAQKEQQQDT